MITRSEKQESKGGSKVSVREREGAGSGTLARPDAFGATPFALMRRMAEDMDRMFESFGLGRGRFTPRFWSEAGERSDQPELAVWAPEIEVFEREGEFVVRADLPGLKKDDVRVEVTDNALILEGERRKEQEERREGFYRSERSYGHFSRAIPLPEGAETEDVKARFKDGVLEVKLPTPKRPEQRRRTIEIGSA